MPPRPAMCFKSTKHEGCMHIHMVCMKITRLTAFTSKAKTRDLCQQTSLIRQKAVGCIMKCLVGVAPALAVVVNPSLFDKAILFEAPTPAAQGQRMNEK